MKISELINKLKMAKHVYGDIDAVIHQKAGLAKTCYDTEIKGGKIYRYESGKIIFIIS